MKGPPAVMMLSIRWRPAGRRMCAPADTPDECEALATMLDDMAGREPSDLREPAMRRAASTVRAWGRKLGKEGSRPQAGIRQDAFSQLARSETTCK